MRNLIKTCHDKPKLKEKMTVIVKTKTANNSYHHEGGGTFLKTRLSPATHQLIATTRWISVAELFPLVKLSILRKPEIHFCFKGKPKRRQAEAPHTLPRQFFVN